MSNRIQSIRGMNDILPTQTAMWQCVETTLRKILVSYGYDEIRFPDLEKTELFVRLIGETTDIVTKEMYTFEDRNGDSLTLRPEGTASCVRACMQHGLLNSSQKLWYMGPMFRHERPQKGRYRQFHQIGVEVFGVTGPDIDAEILLMCARMWDALGLDDIKLQINTLGKTESRSQYRAALMSYFSDHINELDDESKERLNKNPLRILDSKNPDLKSVIQEAPVLLDHIDTESNEHFSQLRALLDAAGLAYEVNPRLVRGLDYYGRTVFEWLTDKLGAQSAVCAGGRYDGLVEHFGGKHTPAIGFGAGLERLIELVSLHGETLIDESSDVYFILAGDEASTAGMVLTEKLREKYPDLKISLNLGGGSFKSQFKKADKSGARIALILGEDECRSEQIAIKYLRDPRDQCLKSWSELPEFLKHEFSAGNSG